MTKTEQIAALVSAGYPENVAKLIVAGQAGSADAKVAPTAKARPVNTAPYTLARGNYKGHPTVTFSRDGSRPVVMGHGKIKLVLQHADALRKIVG